MDVKIARVHEKNRARGCFCFYQFDQFDNVSGDPQKIRDGEVCLVLRTWAASNFIWYLVVWRGKCGFILPEHLEIFVEDDRMSAEYDVKNSQDIIPTMTVILGGIPKKVQYVLSIAPSVEWRLSDGTYQTLPRDFQLQIAK